jgi:hypothetical protein
MIFEYLDFLTYSNVMHGVSKRSKELIPEDRPQLKKMLYLSSTLAEKNSMPSSLPKMFYFHGNRNPTNEHMTLPL